MSLRAWIYIWTVLLTGTTITLVSLLTFNHATANWLAFGVLTTLAILSQFYETEGTYRNAYYPHSVFFLAGAIMLNPLQFILVVAIPHTLELIKKRLTRHVTLRAWYIQPFNIATHIIAGYGTYLIYLLTEAQSDLFQTPFRVLLVLLLAVTYALLNHLLIGLALLFARGLSFHQSGLMKVESLLPDVVLGCLGYIMVVLWEVDPWLIVPALSTLVLMNEALKIPMLKQDAQTDAKTGLLNAKYFNRVFGEELEQATRFKRPLAVLMADLDFMRNINNIYGHVAGDAVLAGIGKIIRQNIPDEATAGRFGGEEFAIVLPGVGQTEAKQIGERIRLSIEKTEFEVSTCPTPIHATMSLGVACFPQDSATLTGLTHAADVAVYQAKRSGRNQIVCAADVPKSVMAEQAGVQHEEQVIESEGATKSNLTLPVATTDLEPLLASDFNRELADKTNLLHDSLTNLPNRARWLEHLNRALSREIRQPFSLGVLLFDLDRFKLVNDSLGHAIGDQLLVAFASRIRSCVRPPDVLARVGDDEFALLVEMVKSESELVQIAERIVEALQTPFILGDHTLHVTSSIGVLITKHSYQSTLAIMRDLNIALHQAKSKGKARYQIFEAGMNEQVLAQFELEKELRQALELDQFELYYQSKIELTSGDVKGMEALVRWKHPTRGLLSPNHFIRLAEETGLICQLGDWVLEEACKQIWLWNTLPLRDKPLIMSINLSVVQLGQPDLIERIAQILQRTGVNPEWIQLEITESVLMEETGISNLILNRLKALGVKLAIDDFGTGYSSLSYLKHFPLDTLKIDRTFIADLNQNAESRAIVQAILQLGHALKLLVIAEGVESEEELKQLNILGCEQGQGYYFARPLPATAWTPQLLKLRGQQVSNPKIVCIA